MADISLKEAFDIYQKQSDSIHKLWAYFQVISIAVLGYTIGSDKGKWLDSTYILVAVSYLVFAVANQWVVIFSQKELYKFGEAVRMASKNTGPIGEQLVVEAVKPWIVSLFHTFAAAMILAAIVATWHDKCPGPAYCPSPSMTKEKSP